MIRMLKIRAGEKRDAADRAVGDDWMLATLGSTHDGYHVYITTDRIRASEVGFIDLIQPEAMALWIVEHLGKALADPNQTEMDLDR